MTTMRSDAGFGWQTLIKSAAPQGCALAGALLTTYDRAEARLLAETLLPEWLALSHTPSDADTLEQTSFALELDFRLKHLHNRIVVVSSTVREGHAEADVATADEGLYPWIWRSIRQFTVGKTGKAVQHAKLWLLHWVHPEQGEFLEIVVSSANLTRAAFKDQIQAAWRVCLPLLPKPSKARSSAWGVLPGFVRAWQTPAAKPHNLTALLICWHALTAPQVSVLLPACLANMGHAHSGVGPVCAALPRPDEGRSRCPS